MSLTITIGTLTLARAEDAVSNLQLSGEVAAEVQRGIRATLARAVNRGNYLDTVSFTVVRKHESLAAAQQHLVRQFLDFRKLFGDSGTPGLNQFQPFGGMQPAVSTKAGVSAKFEWDSGTLYTPYLLDAVPVAQPQATHTGVSTFVSYSLQGNWSETAPVNTTTNFTTHVTL